MMVEKRLRMELGKTEYSALKQVLGSMNDEAFDKAELTVEQREFLIELYNMIPYPDEE